MRGLHKLFGVAAVDRDVPARALETDFADYEEAVLHEAARAVGAAAIVTRNGRNLAKATTPSCSQEELLAALAAAP